MRKILFATSALVGATAIASSALAGGTHAVEQAKPNAGALTVMVGGQIDFQGGLVDQDVTNPGERDGRFSNDTEIHVQVSGSTDSFDYGAVIELNADISDDANNDGGNADKAFIFVENDGFGRVELGGNSGASETLEVDASNIARATGGIDGDWHRYVNTGNTIIRPNLNTSADWADADAEKITYYTPRFSGVQLGASYIVDTNNGSTTAVSNLNNDGGYEGVFAGGINYEGNINENVGLEAALVGEYGQSEQLAGVDREDLRSWSAGLGVNFAGFSLAGNYADLGDSGAFVGTDADQTYWSLGAAYENGPFGLSATYLDSSADYGVAGSADLKNLSFGADYQLAPGFVPYVEATFFDIDDTTVVGGVGSNKGNVILVGSELTF